MEKFLGWKRNKKLGKLLGKPNPEPAKPQKEVGSGVWQKAVLSGHGGARVLDFARREGGVLRNLRCGGCNITFEFCNLSEKALFRVAKKSGCEVLSISLAKPWKTGRNILLFSTLLAVFACVVLSLSALCFRVEISGEAGEVYASIENYTSENFSAFSVVTEEKINELKTTLAENSAISLFSVEFYSGKLSVSFMLSENGSVILKSGEVVAKSSGVVLSLVTYSGTQKVEVGDYVEYGDVLISPEVGKETTMQAPASGAGVLLVSSVEIVEVPLVFESKTQTGNVQTDSYFSVFGWEVFKSDCGFADFDAERVETNFFFGGISYIKETRSEVSREVVALSEEEAKAVAEEIAKTSQTTTLSALQNIGSTAQTVDGICTVEVKFDYLLHFAS